MPIDELQKKYEEMLKSNRGIHKIPFIETVPELTEKIKVLEKTDSVSEKGLSENPYAHTLRDINIKQDNKTMENNIQVYQRGLTMNKYGRLRGNMEYLEDSWDIQIQPVAIKFAYLKNDSFAITEAFQMRIRDKYLKVRVRYDGTKYALVNAIKTQYIISYV